MISDIILTGIKPTGTPHLGNYLGAIKPALDMAKHNPDAKKLFFIADYHALTTLKDKKKMAAYRKIIAATWLAFFKDVPGCTFYFQSDVPEIFELYWILSCYCPKGLLNRAHAYKALVSQNIEHHHDPDRQINQGAFSYPVLMAADILLFHANTVPIGPDQKQHIEIAIEIVKTLNHQLNTPIPIPKPIIDHQMDVVIGLDGRKMSKNYDNTIPLFADETIIKKRINKIKTNSTPLGSPLDPDTCHIIKLLSYLVPTPQLDDIKNKYRTGEIGYGHAKQYLLTAYMNYFQDANSHYTEKLDQAVAEIRKNSAEVPAMAKKNLEKIKADLGLSI
tara:strand:+ start:757 stop:1755 length:999 start_codon:yes stop_codon:yes gene_type:complete